MDADNTESIKLRLANLAREIQAIYEILDQEEPELPIEAQQKLAAGLCLECGKPISSQEKSKRGCHERCHRKILRAIDRGKYTEFAAISAGHLAPKGKGGRPPQLTQLEMMTETKEQNQMLKSPDNPSTEE